MSLCSWVAVSLKLHIDKPVKRAERRLFRTPGAARPRALVTRADEIDDLVLGVVTAS
jgi:hypothetical protein